MFARAGVLGVVLVASLVLTFTSAHAGAAPFEAHANFQARNAPVPAGLQFLGANEREYDGEARDFLDRLVAGQAPTATMVRERLDYWFTREEAPVPDHEAADFADALLAVQQRLNA
jgi:hypothetical protein